MTSSPLVFIHVCGAFLGLLSGAAALLLRKGSRPHRAAGNVFFVSMLCMSASAAYVAAFMRPNLMNVVAGVLTFYLVATAWLTVRRKEGESGLLEVCLMLAALADGAAALNFGWEAANGATGMKDGTPAAAYFVFGSVALLAASLDVKTLIRGGTLGAHRIARHLWRMCFAMLIATTSLFLGRQQMFPEAIRKTQLLNVPILIVVGLTIFWLCRVLFSKAYKKPRGQLPPRRESLVKGGSTDDRMRTGSFS
jgi:hypothetical protein